MTAPHLTVTVTHKPPNFDPRLTSWGKKINKNKRIKFHPGDSKVTSLSHLIPKVFSLLHQLYLHAHVPGLLALCPKQMAVLVRLLFFPRDRGRSCVFLMPLSGSKCAAVQREAVNH